MAGRMSKSECMRLMFFTAIWIYFRLPST